MKKLILNFLRPFVLSILKDALKVETNNGVITGIQIASDPPNPVGPFVP